MPTYDYRCKDGHEFEVFHKMSEDGPDTCEVCGKSPVEIVLYPVAVHFKGSGFYSTDYGRGNSKRENAKEGESSSGEGQNGEKSESGEKSASEKGDKSDKGGATSDSKPKESSDSKSKKKSAES
jgi:putative FmdB family regulatory protein